MVWLAAVAAGFVLLVAWDLVSQWLARDALRSTHVVYYLVDRSGVVLYVGSTNDHTRRFLEHVDEGEPGEWRKRIVGQVVVRYCWGERQARRVERRMIRAVMDGSRWRMCPPLHNVALVGRSAVPSVSRLVWLAAYRVNGVLWPVTRWHGPNPSVRWNRAGEGQRSALHAPVWVEDSPVVPVAYPVSVADSPNGAPLGALTPADTSAPVTPADTTPPEDEVPPSRHLHSVPPDEVDDLPSDPAARRREQNRRYQAAKRARERQAREAG